MDLPEWLEQKIKKQEWQPSDLARKAGVYTGTITRILNRERGAGPIICRAIAKALIEPEENIFRLAGLLSPKSKPEDPFWNTVGLLWPRLPDWKKQDLIVQMRAAINDHQPKP